MCNAHTLWMSKPMATLSPLPSLDRTLLSCCCRQIRTSSSGFVTSNTYWRTQKHSSVHLYTTHTHTHTHTHTCGFCRNVALWLMQPPDRFIKGSSWRHQAPRITSSSQVLWMLRYDVLIKRHRIRSVKYLQKSSKSILDAGCKKNDHQ